MQVLKRALLTTAIMMVLASANAQAQSDEESSSMNAASVPDAAASKDDEQRSPWVGQAVNVTAKGTAADVPSALATDVLTWQDAAGSPSDFQDLITRVPGVGATGQNGIFETFSIRGSGGNGILVLVGGMPITAQRRAGVPVAFVEPSLLGEINVTRGPATVHFGSGALGGAVSIEPRWFDTGTISAGYASGGDETSVLGGFGNETFSIAAARHEAEDTQAPNGRALNTSFERESASLQYRTQIGAVSVDAMLLPSRTKNIGKSNSRYPVRDSTYPIDEHTVARVRVEHENGFQVSLHGHDQILRTYNQRPGSPDSFASIASLDMGGTVQQTFEAGEFVNNIGVEYLGRRDVNGFDARRSLLNRTYSLRDASEDSWSMFALSDWHPSTAFAMEFGGRYTSVDQDQAGAGSTESDSALTTGAIWTPTDASRWTANLSTGYRFATLEERFFTGVTPQGEIIGNPNLGAENSLGLDLGYAWQQGNWGADVHVWRTDVDDLIQLFAIAPGVNGYTNVGEATLHGAEGSVQWRPLEPLSLRAAATVVRSKDEATGDPLYGSPPLTVSLDAKYDFSKFTMGAFYSHRWSMTRPGFEELERDSVDILDLDLSYHLNPSWDLKLYVRNAIDETYFATADELSAFAPERSVGFNVTWTLN